MIRKDENSAFRLRTKYKIRNKGRQMERQNFTHEVEIQSDDKSWKS